MKTILITGANGQLGTELKIASQLFKFNYIFTDVDTLDITNIDALSSFFESNTIDYIINCAAYTAVDKAESESGRADLINCKAVESIASIAKKHKSKLIHISTDYVFDGTASEPYKENHKVNPQSVYGHTKLKGEQAIINSCVEYIIIRTSWLYSSFGYNFVKTMLRLGNEKESISVVSDQTGTPCYAYDLAVAILTIIDIAERDKFVSGIYNYSNEGICTWYDFAKEIFAILKIECKVLPIETKDYPTPAKRPKYSVLDKSLIKSIFEIHVPAWEVSLRVCLKKVIADKL